MPLFKEHDFDIGRNIKALDWLKTELVLGAGRVCRAFESAHDEAVLGALADIVLLAYLMARRLGITFSRLENEVELRAGSIRQNDHEFEKWYNDLSNLAAHLAVRREK